MYMYACVNVSSKFIPSVGCMPVAVTIKSPWHNKLELISLVTLCWHDHLCDQSLCSCTMMICLLYKCSCIGDHQWLISYEWFEKMLDEIVSVNKFILEVFLFCTNNLLLIPDANIVSTSVFIWFIKCSGVLKAVRMYPGLLIQVTLA